jgi:hypothetical protein
LDLETIHYGCLLHLKNVTAFSIDNNNAAVATAQAYSKIDNKMVQEYVKDLEHIKFSESEPITSTDMLNTVLTFTAIATCYFLLIICFTPSYIVNLLLATYKPREWAKKSKIQKVNNLNKEMEP